MAQRGEETWTWRLFGKIDDEKTLAHGHPFWYRRLIGEGAIFCEPVGYSFHLFEGCGGRYTV